MALTVLIVEDEQSASRLLSGIAAEVGLSARATGSGREAQQLCAQAADSGQPFSAVVLDLVLSELDGFPFAAAARAAAWGAKLAITFQQGMVRFAQSNVRAETVWASQIASGLIKQTSFDRAVALAKQQNIPLHEALATARVMTPDQLRTALKQQTTEVCVAALEIAAGSYRFEQKPAEAVNGVPDLRT